MRLPLRSYRRRLDKRHLRDRVLALEAELAAQWAATPPLSDVTQMLHSISDAVVVADLDLRIRAWNPAAEALFGWAASEVLGRRTLEFLALRYPDGTSREQVIAALHAQGAWRGEAIITRRDGEECVVEAGAQLLYDAHGAVVGSLSISRDITAARAAAAEREQLLARESAARLELEHVLATQTRITEELGRSEARLAVLAEASRCFADATLNLDELSRTITRYVADTVGDLCSLRLLSPDKTLLLVAHTAHPDPAGQALAAAINPIAQRADEGHTSTVIREGQALYMPVLPPQFRMAVPPQFLPYLDRFGMQSLIIVPLRVHGQVIGTLTLARNAGGSTYTPDDLATLEDLADRAALALSYAQSLAEEQAARRKHADALALLDAIYATAPVGLAFLDTELRYLRVNQRFAEMGSQIVERRPGHTTDELLSEVAATMGLLHQQVLQTGEALYDIALHSTTPAAPDAPRDWLASYYPVRSADGAVAGVGVVVVETTERKQIEQELRAAAVQLQGLSRRLVEVHERERRAVARELHDEIGQVLTGLKLTLGAITADAPARMAATLADAQASITELTGRVRSLSLDLRPALLDDLGLLPALDWYLGRYTPRTGVTVDLRHQGLDRRFPPEVETVAFRTVQEALTNIARYAGVSSVTVLLRADHERLMLRVDDAGRGFHPEAALNAQTTGGLSGMHERIKLIGGMLTIEAAPDEGTQIIAELPLDVEGLHQ